MEDSRIVLHTLEKKIKNRKETEDEFSKENLLDTQEILYKHLSYFK